MPKHDILDLLPSEFSVLFGHVEVGHKFYMFLFKQQVGLNQDVFISACLTFCAGEYFVAEGCPVHGGRFSNILICTH